MMKLSSIDGTDPVGMTLGDIKDYLYITSDDDDALIALLARVAREYGQARQWRQIIPATYILYLDKFPNGVIELPYPPAISVTSVKYYNTDNTLTTFSNYETDVNSEPARIRPVSGESWPEVYDKLNAVEITYSAGYDNSDKMRSLPDSTRQAMMLMIKHWYDNRDPVVVSEGRAVDTKEVPLSANALFDLESARTP